PDADPELLVCPAYLHVITSYLSIVADLADLGTDEVQPLDTTDELSPRELTLLLLNLADLVDRLSGHVVALAKAVEQLPERQAT
ncbi:MAG TPA: hypothetical protein VFI48_03990, partial [Hyphomicrobiaceae bacterium]|nr:hypothetical protein [Hyphomicrobiaceae bacterium]